MNVPDKDYFDYERNKKIYIMSVSVKKRKYISCFNADIPEIVTPKRSYTTGYDSDVRIECWNYLHQV
jgi:hypothetical protein